MATFFEFPRNGRAYNASDLEPVMAGLFERDANGLVSSGVVGAAPLVSAVASSWRVRVGSFAFLRQVGAGACLSGVSFPEEVTITPAAGNLAAGQSRFDLICWDAENAQLKVVEGTPALEPVKPAAGSFALIASVLVRAGDGQTLQNQITVECKLAKLVASSGVSGSVSHPAGGSLVAGSPFFFSPNYRVDFAERFPHIPHILVTASAADARVMQWAQVYSVSETGFYYRIVSLGQAPQTGTLYWSVRG